MTKKQPVSVPQWLHRNGYLDDQQRGAAFRYREKAKPERRSLTAKLPVRQRRALENGLAYDHRPRFVIAARNAEGMRIRPSDTRSWRDLLEGLRAIR